MLPPEVIKSIVEETHNADQPDMEGMKKAASKDAARKLMQAFQSGSESDFLSAYEHFNEVLEHGRNFGNIANED